MDCAPRANLAPMLPGILNLPRDDQDPPRLLGSFCPACQRHFFPRPSYCPQCLGPLDQVTLPLEGTIYSYTVVRTKAPWGLPQPYSVGYVDLAQSGLRIFCLLDPEAIDQLRVGLPVRMAVGPLGHGLRGDSCLRPYFTPQTKDRG